MCPSPFSSPSPADPKSLVHRIDPRSVSPAPVRYAARAKLGPSSRSDDLAVWNQTMRHHLHARSSTTGTALPLQSQPARVSLGEGVSCGRRSDRDITAEVPWKSDSPERPPVEPVFQTFRRAMSSLEPCLATQGVFRDCLIQRSRLKPWLRTPELHFSGRRSKHTNFSRWRTMSLPLLSAGEVQPMPSIFGRASWW